MANLNGFNANNVEPASDFDPIPAAKYAAVITNSEFKPTKNGSGNYLELTFQVIEGQYKNRLLWARLNLEHQNEMTAKISRGQLAAICQAVGIMTPKDSAELHNLPLIINVKLKKRTDTGELANEIKGYTKRETGQAAAAAVKPTIPPWKR